MELTTHINIGESEQIMKIVCLEELTLFRISQDAIRQKLFENLPEYLQFLSHSHQKYESNDEQGILDAVLS